MGPLAFQGPCQVAAFSADGEFVATGSADSSIKYLDVDKMHYHTQVKASSAADFDSSRPVLRTFYDHQLVGAMLGDVLRLFLTMLV
jgi:cleavage stimulation factor subunit 1